MTTLVFMTFLAVGAPPELPIEAPVPADAVPLDEVGRYRAVHTFDETLEYYKRIFTQTGGVRWRNIVNLPSIKAKHVESMRKKTHWEGVNIYEKQGEVRLYVIPRGAGSTAGE